MSVSAGPVIRGGKVYVLAVGINQYNYLNKPGLELDNCESDAKRFVQYARDNTPNGNVKAYTLLGSRASRDNIRSVLRQMADSASATDRFLFYFGGFSFEDDRGETYLFTHLESGSDFPDIFKYRAEIRSIKGLVNLAELSAWLEPLQCGVQLFVSEAGSGSNFAQNLLYNLFEQNPLIAYAGQRERIILTTTGYGRDNVNCNSIKQNMGPLMYALTKHNNLKAIMDNPQSAYCELSQTLAPCDESLGDYISIFNENNYRQMLNALYRRSAMRGGKSVRTDLSRSDSVTAPGTYALLIGTNDYESRSEWAPLKNAIRDARAVRDVLERKFNVKCTLLENVGKDSILLTLLTLKSMLQPEDQFLFFIAGHGYYNPDFSDGYLVFTDSKRTDAEIGLGSYLQMATLHRILDNMPGKQVFAIFDVCFGGTFDQLSSDIELNTYTAAADLNSEELKERKSQYISRIFLASGMREVPDFWFSGAGHSPFADKILESLEQTADFSSPGRLFRDLETNATEPVLRKFGKHEERGDFIMRVGF
ncbi:MAG: caspase family protein [Flavobacteriales bacterium]|nr:caspase family protein [Flavobacteriales bacterium]